MLTDFVPLPEFLAALQESNVSFQETIELMRNQFVMSDAALGPTVASRLADDYQTIEFERVKEREKDYTTVF